MRMGDWADGRMDASVNGRIGVRESLGAENRWDLWDSWD